MKRVERFGSFIPIAGTRWYNVTYYVFILVGILSVEVFLSYLREDTAGPPLSVHPKMRLSPSVSTIPVQVSTQSKSIEPQKTSPFDLTTDILVLVFTNPEDRSKRDALRDSWVSDYKGSSTVLVMFVLGIQGINEETKNVLNDEEKNFADLLFLADYDETSERRSEKLLYALHWAVENVKCKYLLKVGQDTYVALEKILQRIQVTHSSKPILMGSIKSHDLPVRPKLRDPKSKWLSGDWNLCPHYLPYPTEIGYIISFNVVKGIVAASNVPTLRMLKSADITLGIWISVFDMEYINIDKESSGQGSCNLNGLFFPKQSSDMLKKRHVHFKQTGNLCP